MSSPSTVINIFILKINSFENASAVNIGQNFLAEWSNSDKRNQGYGQNSGDGVEFLEPRCFVDDKDGVDSPSFFHPTLQTIPDNNKN
jgi:hypothetical protein